MKSGAVPNKLWVGMFRLSHRLVLRHRCPLRNWLAFFTVHCILSHWTLVYSSSLHELFVGPGICYANRRLGKLFVVHYTSCWLWKLFPMRVVPYAITRTCYWSFLTQVAWFEPLFNGVFLSLVVCQQKCQRYLIRLTVNSAEIVFRNEGYVLKCSAGYVYLYQWRNRRMQKFCQCLTYIVSFWQCRKAMIPVAVRP